ncbi:hypothetical protein [Streptomyces phaeoluteigriseus]
MSSLRTGALFGVVAGDAGEFDSGAEHCVRALSLLERGRRR